jgi:hypothetical protein
MGLEGFGGGDGQGAREAALALARLYLCTEDGGVVTADASPENLCWLRARHPGAPLRIAGAEEVRAAILRRHGTALRHEAVEGLERLLPDLSARHVLTPAQGAVLALLGGALAAGLLLWPRALLQGLVFALSAGFVLSGLFRALLAWAGSGRSARPAPLPRHGLPRYTILVPLYREAAVLPGLVGALAALDYPGMLAQVPQEI